MDFHNKPKVGMPRMGDWRLGRREFVKTAAEGLLVGMAGPELLSADGDRKLTQAHTRLSEVHLAAVNRRRRITSYCDTGFDPTGVKELQGMNSSEVVGKYFS